MGGGGADRGLAGVDPSWPSLKKSFVRKMDGASSLGAGGTGVAAALGAASASPAEDI